MQKEEKMLSLVPVLGAFDPMSLVRALPGMFHRD